MKNNFIFAFLLTSPLFAQAQWQSCHLDSVNLYSVSATDSTVMAGRMGGLYISSDYGQHWTLSTLNTSSYNVCTLAKSGSRLFEATTNALRYSDDYGTSWNSLNQFINFTVYDLEVANNQIYNASLFGARRSNDNGITWTDINNGLPPVAYTTDIAVEGTHLYAVADSTVYISSDNGNSWDTANTGLGNNRVCKLAIQGTNVYAATTLGVFISTNQGALWSIASNGLPNARVYSLAMNGANVFAATDSGVFTTHDQGNTWINISQGLPNTHTRFLAVSGPDLLVTLATPTSNGALYRLPLQQVMGIDISSADKHDIRLFPNPTQTSFQLFGLRSEISSLVIVNINGACVWKDTHSKRSPNETIWIPQLPAGMYSVRFNCDGVWVTQKLMICR